MRIIAGTHKGRSFRAPNLSGTRPVSDRSRETIFNLIGSLPMRRPDHPDNDKAPDSDNDSDNDLAPNSDNDLSDHGGASHDRKKAPSPENQLQGIHVIDAFCGSGAFGLESLSRGAAHVIFIDWQRQALMQTRDNVLAIGEEDKSIFLCRNVLRPGHPPPKAAGLCTLFFIAPPWTKNYYRDSLAALRGKNWLAPGAVGVVESSCRQDFSPPEGFLLLDKRRQGDSLYTLLQNYVGMR